MAFDDPGFMLVSDLYVSLFFFCTTIILYQFLYYMKINFYVLIFFNEKAIGCPLQTISDGYISLSFKGLLIIRREILKA